MNIIRREASNEVSVIFLSEALDERRLTIQGPGENRRRASAGVVRLPLFG
jgi:hypothetical protein